MKIYILGGGWIGKTIFHGIENKRETILLGVDEIDKIIENDSIIINCAGVSHPTKCDEKNQQREIRHINKLLSLSECNTWSLIHISSASVISYNENYPEIEADCSKAISQYSKHKCQIERKLLQNHKVFKNLKIVRLFSLYGINGKKQIIHDIFNKFLTENHRYEIPSSKVTRSFVSESQLIRGIEILIDNILLNKKEKQIINLSGTIETNIKDLIFLCYGILNKLLKKEFTPNIIIKNNLENPIATMHPRNVNNLSTQVEENFHDTLFDLFYQKTKIN